MMRNVIENKVYIAVFLFFLFVYVISARGEVQNVDELTMFASLLNLMEKGTLAIDELSDLNENIDDRIGFYGKDGHLYSKYSPGTVLFGGVLYLLGDLVSPQLGGLLALYLNAFLGATGILCLLIFSDRYFSLKTSLFVVFLIGLCSIWWYQSRGFGLETGGGTFLIMSLLLADLGKAGASTFLFSISLYFRTLNLLAWPIWGLSIMRAGRRAIGTALIILLFFIGLLAYNYARFDSITNFGYDNLGFTTPILFGLKGLFLSPGRSLILYSPVFILALPGVWKWIQIDKPLSVVLTCTVVVYICAVAAWVSWEGGWSWGSRLITPIVPLIGILIAPVIEATWKKQWIFIILIFFAVWGFGINIVSLARDPLLVLRESVMAGAISYESTVYTLENSHLLLQIKALSNWSSEMLDSLILRVMLTK